MENTNSNRQEGIVNLNVPLQFVFDNNGYVLTVGNFGQEQIIHWNNKNFDPSESQRLVDFVKFVYRLGYSHGALTALTSPPDTPMGNYMFPSQICAGFQQNPNNTCAKIVVSPTCEQNYSHSENKLCDPNYSPYDE